MFVSKLAQLATEWPDSGDLSELESQWMQRLRCVPILV